MKDLPNNPTAERAVLYSLVVEPERLGGVLQYIGPDDFAAPEHRVLFEVICETILDQERNDGQCDFVVLRDRLASRGAERDGVSIRTLIEAVDEVQKAGAVACNAGYYAQRVLEARQERDLVRAYRTAGATVESNAALTEKRAALEGLALAASETGARDELHTVAEVLPEALASMDERPERFPSGLPDLDDLLDGGVGRGEVCVLAARPGGGKSSLGAQWAAASARGGRGVLFASCEMKPADLLMRMLGQQERVNVRTLAYNPRDREILAAAGRQATAWPILFAGPGRLNTVESIHAATRHLTRTRRVKLVVIDYLQLLTVAQKTESLRVRIVEITRRLKLLALSENVAVLLLSQLRRADDDHLPSLSDLKESGSIEQDADLVVMLHRPQVEGESLVKVLIRKNRRGRTGAAEMVFVDDYCLAAPAVREPTFRLHRENLA